MNTSVKTLHYRHRRRRGKLGGGTGWHDARMWLNDAHALA